MPAEELQVAAGSSTRSIAFHSGRTTNQKKPSPQQMPSSNGSRSRGYGLSLRDPNPYSDPQRSGALNFTTRRAISVPGDRR
jgi:hypothetical protein